MEASFLGSEEDGIDAIEGAEAAGGEASFGFAGRFIEGGDTEGEGFGATLFEDAEEVAWLADIKAGEGVEKGENPVQAGFFGGGGEGVIELERDAIGTVGLADDGIFEIDRPVIVSGGIPEHAAVVHHGIADPFDDITVTESAGLFGDAEVAGVDEADKFWRFVIESGGGVWRVSGGGPEFGVTGGDVRLFQGQPGVGIAAVAVGAAEDHIGGSVHGVGVGGFVAIHATDAFAMGFCGGLIDPIAWGSWGRFGVNGECRGGGAEARSVAEGRLIRVGRKFEVEGAKFPRRDVWAGALAGLGSW